MVDAHFEAGHTEISAPFFWDASLQEFIETLVDVEELVLKDVGGVFEKTRGAGVRIWVTADDRQMPVRLESELALGSFVAELVSAEGLNGPSIKEDL